MERTYTLERAARARAVATARGAGGGERRAVQVLQTLGFAVEPFGRRDVALVVATTGVASVADGRGV